MLPEKIFKILFIVIGILFMAIPFSIYSFELVENLLLLNFSFFFHDLGVFFFLIGLTFFILGALITPDESQHVFSITTTNIIYIFGALLPFLLILIQCFFSMEYGTSNFFETIYGVDAFFSNLIWISFFLFPLYIAQIIFIVFCVKRILDNR